MEKFFNTAGPVRAENNYMIDPLNRINKDEIMTLIDNWRYFILHAPRQTGKTSSLLALQDYINKEGRYKCLYVNIETAQTARSNVAKGMKAIISSLDFANSITLGDDFFNQFLLDGVDKYGENDVLKRILSLWSLNNKKKIILLIDEIDALVGDTLISVLRQLRSGYAKRPDSFPQSVVLCGVRDVRDYRIFSDRDQQIITGGSAFNV
ncbi:MAG: ATP-binding protein, partial [Thermotogota bacterium]|nr:ATP-binding protein [Thermotogota bacterium]